MQNWVISASLIAGVNLILRSVIHDFYAPLYETLQKNRENSKINFLPILVFDSSLLYIMGDLAGGGYVAVTGDRWQGTGGM